MKIQYFSISLILISSALSGCGNSELPISIDTYNRVNRTFNNFPYVEVVVTAKTDNITIEDIIVNRGNCIMERKNQFTSDKPIPTTLNFGTSVSSRFSGPCHASEVEIKTDQGNWTIEYN